MIRDCLVKFALLTRTGMEYLFEMPLDEAARIIRSAGKASRK